MTNFLQTSNPFGFGQIDPSFARFAPGYTPHKHVEKFTHSQRLMAVDALRTEPQFTRNLGQYQAFDAATAGGMAFLEGELEKRDMKVRQPLSSITYDRDMIFDTGGGWVNNTSTLWANYGSPGSQPILSLMGTQTTAIPIIETELGKDIWPVASWKQVLKVTFEDLNKAANAGRSLDSLLEDGLRFKYNKDLDFFVYLGWGQNAGLFNNPNITQYTVPNGASGSPLWTQKTPNEIIFDVQSVITNTWIASGADLSGMASHILIPISDFDYIASLPVTSAGSESVLEWLLKKNSAKTQGVDVKIFPSKWAAGAGVGATNRMLGYVLNKDRVYFDVTVPLTRIMTTPSVEQGGAYLTLFAAQIGVVKALAPTSMAYADGI